MVREAAQASREASHPSLERHKVNYPQMPEATCNMVDIQPNKVDTV